MYYFWYTHELISLFLFYYFEVPKQVFKKN